MTWPSTPPSSAQWRYRRDPTHVVVYHAQTFRELAALRGWICESPAKDIALLCKPLCGAGAA